MLTIKYLVEAPREYREFINGLISTINYFNEAVKYYDSKSDTTIKNTDLWIEAYIEIFPDLQDFRAVVKKEMKRLNIEPYLDFIYKETDNHYIYGHKKEIERLRLAMNKA